jgi:hypothetical protein
MGYENIFIMNKKKKNTATYLWTYVQVLSFTPIIWTHHFSKWTSYDQMWYEYITCFQSNHKNLRLITCWQKKYDITNLIHFTPFASKSSCACTVYNVLKEVFTANEYCLKSQLVPQYSLPQRNALNTKSHCQSKKIVFSVNVSWRIFWQTAITQPSLPHNLCCKGLKRCVAKQLCQCSLDTDYTFFYTISPN